jgi:hypothetical protein
MPEKYRVETEDGSEYEIEVEGEAPAASAPTSLRPGLKSFGDVAMGVVKGAGKSLMGAYDLVRRNPGILFPPAMVAGEVAAAAGAMPQLPEPPAWMREAVETKTTGEAIGSGAEQVAEFLIPGRAVAKGAAALAPKLKSLARPAMEAAGAGSVAAVQSGGDPAEIAKAAGTAGVVSGLLSPSAWAAKKLYESAKASYARALRPTTKPMKKTAERVIPELLERRVSAVTLGGLEEKAQSALAVAGQQLDDALDLMSKNPSAPRIATRPLIDALESYKGGFIVDGVPINEKAVRTIEGLQDTISQLGSDVSFESMRRVRQLLDAKVAWRKGFVMPLEEGSTIDATREAAHAIRKELADAAPDIAKINKEYSFWKKVGDVVGETIERTRPQAPRLGERLMSAAGAAGGFTKGGVQGAAIGAATMRGLTKLVNSTAWNTVSAVNKARLADLIGGGKFDQANHFMAQLAAGAVTDREPKKMSPPPQ